jgi:hypothetical protein
MKRSRWFLLAANGSFHGVLEVPSSANPTPAPALVEDGTFSLPLTDLGI